MTGSGGAGEGDHILGADMAQQVAGAAANQLKRAGGKNAGSGNLPDDRLREEGGHRSRFDDGGDTGQEVDGDLLEHPPDGEVKSVDMDGGAFFGDQDMLAHESIAFTEVHPFPIETEGGVRKFAAEGGIGKEIADAAFEVDPTVGAGRAGE